MHAHFWAGEYLDLLVDLGRSDLGRQSPNYACGLAEMDRAEVDVQVWSAVGVNVEVG